MPPVLMRCGMVALTLGGLVMRGFILSRMWGWYVVVLFALPPIRVVDAIALDLAFTYGVLLPLYRGKPEKPLGERLTERAAMVLIGYPCTLGFAWAMHWLMVHT